MKVTIPEKEETVKTSIDLNKSLLQTVKLKMKKRGHNMRKIVEAFLKQYVQDEK